MIAAAANVSAEDEFVVVGSQAVLGSFPDAPEALLQSMEVDLYPAHAPEKSDEIDGAIGDGSRFHESFGYYAHGVGQRRRRPRTVGGRGSCVCRCRHESVLSAGL